MFVDTYLDHASEWAFLDENESGTIGYLTGAIGARFLNVQILSCCSVTARMVWSPICGPESVDNTTTVGNSSAGCTHCT